MTDLRPCVFLDRDGVINRERGDYTWRVDDFDILPGVPETLQKLKEAGFLLVLITNQAGIARGRYGHEDVARCHTYMQEQCSNAFDGIYYSPYHPDQTESLSRKPGRLLFEKAIARFGIDAGRSWMVGDRERDLIPAHQLGMRGILVTEKKVPDSLAVHQAPDLLSAGDFILKG